MYKNNLDQEGIDSELLLDVEYNKRRKSTKSKVEATPKKEEENTNTKRRGVHYRTGLKIGYWFIIGFSIFVFTIALYSMGDSKFWDRENVLITLDQYSDWINFYYEGNLTITILGQDYIIDASNFIGIIEGNIYTSWAIDTLELNKEDLIALYNIDTDGEDISAIDDYFSKWFWNDHEALVSILNQLGRGGSIYVTSPTATLATIPLVAVPVDSINGTGIVVTDMTVYSVSTAWWPISFMAFFLVCATIAYCSFMALSGIEKIRGKKWNQNVIASVTLASLTIVVLGIYYPFSYVDQMFPTSSEIYQMYNSETSYAPIITMYSNEGQGRFVIMDVTKILNEQNHFRNVGTYKNVSFLASGGMLIGLILVITYSSIPSPSDSENWTDDLGNYYRATGNESSTKVTIKK